MVWLCIKMHSELVLVCFDEAFQGDSICFYMQLKVHEQNFLTRYLELATTVFALEI